MDKLLPANYFKYTNLLRVPLILEQMWFLLLLKPEISKDNLFYDSTGK